MVIVWDELEIHIGEAKGKRDAKEYGFTGWYWHEMRRRPVGPFPTAGVAVRDLGERLETGTMPEPSVKRQPDAI